MKNLPKRIFLNLRHTWQIKKGNKCLPDDFIQLRDDCGECITHTLGEPNHEDDPEYILNDKGEFVPEEWGWTKISDSARWVLPRESRGFFYLSCNAVFWNVDGCALRDLTPTLYRLVAEANGIPIPENKK